MRHVQPYLPGRSHLLAMRVAIITSSELAASPACHMQHHDLPDDLSCIKCCCTHSMAITWALCNHYVNQCKHFHMYCHHLVNGSQLLAMQPQRMDHLEIHTQANIAPPSISTCIRLWTCNRLPFLLIFIFMMPLPVTNTVHTETSNSWAWTSYQFWYHVLGMNHRYLHKHTRWITRRRKHKFFKRGLAVCRPGALLLYIIMELQKISHQQWWITVALILTLSGIHPHSRLKWNTLLTLTWSGFQLDCWDLHLFACSSTLLTRLLLLL